MEPWLGTVRLDPHSLYPNDHRLIQPTAPDFTISMFGDNQASHAHPLGFRQIATYLPRRERRRTKFKGSGEKEVGVDTETGAEVVAIDPRYHRPTEVDFLLGDASKARRTFGWAPRCTFVDLVNMMADADLKAVQDGQPFDLEPSLEFLRPVLT